MNDVLEGLLKRHNINPITFAEAMRDVKIERYEDYDDSLSSFAIYGEGKTETVDISRVRGVFSFMLDDEYFLDNFMKLFDPNGDTYHSRANGMLTYDESEVKKKLEYSFRVEPIAVYKIRDEYFIDGNGVHRYMLFKMHHLMDQFRNIKNQDKYLIPVKVEELDYHKTCANFIGSLLWDEEFSVGNDYDKEYHFTGKSRVDYRGKRLVLTDDELVEFMRERIKAIQDLDEAYFNDVIVGIWNKCRWEKTGIFKGFIESYLPELAFVTEIEDYSSLEQAIKEIQIGEIRYGNS